MFSCPQASEPRFSWSPEEEAQLLLAWAAKLDRKSLMQKLYDQLDVLAKQVKASASDAAKMSPSRIGLKMHEAKLAFLKRQQSSSATVAVGPVSGAPNVSDRDSDTANPVTTSYMLKLCASVFIPKGYPLGASLAAKGPTSSEASVQPAADIPIETEGARDSLFIERIKSCIIRWNEDSRATEVSWIRSLASIVGRSTLAVEGLAPIVFGFATAVISSVATEESSNSTNFMLELVSHALFDYVVDGISPKDLSGLLASLLSQLEKDGTGFDPKREKQSTFAGVQIVQRWLMRLLTYSTATVAQDALICLSWTAAMSASPAELLQVLRTLQATPSIQITESQSKTEPFVLLESFFQSRQTTPEEAWTWILLHKSRLSWATPDNLRRDQLPFPRDLASFYGSAGGNLASCYDEDGYFYILSDDRIVQIGTGEKGTERMLVYNAAPAPTLNVSAVSKQLGTWTIAEQNGWLFFKHESFQLDLVGIMDCTSLREVCRISMTNVPKGLPPLSTSSVFVKSPGKMSLLVSHGNDTTLLHLHRSDAIASPRHSIDVVGSISLGRPPLSPSAPPPSALLPQFTTTLATDAFDQSPMRLNSITAQEDFSSYSFEELRWINSSNRASLSAVTIPSEILQLSSFVTTRDCFAVSMPAMNNEHLVRMYSLQTGEHFLDIVLAHEPSSSSAVLHTGPFASERDEKFYDHLRLFVETLSCRLTRPAQPLFGRLRTFLLCRLWSVGTRASASTSSGDVESMIENVRDYAGATLLAVRELLPSLRQISNEDDAGRDQIIRSILLELASMEWLYKFLATWLTAQRPQIMAQIPVSVKINLRMHLLDMVAGDGLDSSSFRDSRDLSIAVSSVRRSAAHVLSIHASSLMSFEQLFENLTSIIPKLEGSGTTSPSVSRPQATRASHTDNRASSPQKPTTPSTLSLADYRRRRSRSSSSRSQHQEEFAPTPQSDEGRSVSAEARTARARPMSPSRRRGVSISEVGLKPLIALQSGSHSSSAPIETTPSLPHLLTSGTSRDYLACQWSDTLAEMTRQGKIRWLEVGSHAMVLLKTLLQRVHQRLDAVNRSKLSVASFQVFAQLPELRLLQEVQYQMVLSMGSAPLSQQAYEIFSDYMSALCANAASLMTSIGGEIDEDSDSIWTTRRRMSNPVNNPRNDDHISRGGSIRSSSLTDLDIVRRKAAVQRLCMKLTKFSSMAHLLAPLLFQLLYFIENPILPVSEWSNYLQYLALPVLPSLLQFCEHLTALHGELARGTSSFVENADLNIALAALGKWSDVSIRVATSWASHLITGEPVSETERVYKTWLKSKLFEGGLREIAGDWLAQKERRFLKDLVKNDVPSSDVGQLLDWMFQQMIRPLAKKGGSAVDKAERAVIACLLKHNDLVEEAMILSDMLSKSSTKQTLESTRSLKHIWDIAYSVRVWIVNEAQKNVASTFDSRENTPKSLHGTPHEVESLNTPTSLRNERSEHLTRSDSHVTIQIPRSAHGTPTTSRELRAAAHEIAKRVIARCDFVLKLNATENPSGHLFSDLNVDGVPSSSPREKLLFGKRKRNRRRVEMGRSFSASILSNPILEGIMPRDHNSLGRRLAIDTLDEIPEDHAESEQGPEETDWPDDVSSPIPIPSAKPSDDVPTSRSAPRLIIPELPALALDRLLREPRKVKSERQMSIIAEELRVAQEVERQQKYGRIKHSFEMWKRLRDKHMHHQYDSPRHRVHEVSESIINFVESTNVSVDLLPKLMTSQRRRAQQRCEGLKSIAHLIEIVPHTKQRSHALEALRTAMTDPNKHYCHHYLKDVSTCGPQVRKNLDASFQQLYQNIIQRLREGGTNSYDEFLLLRLFATQFKHDADCQFLFEIRAFPIMLRRRMPRGNAGDGTNHGSFTFSSSPPPTPHVHQRKGSISGISAARHLDELFHQRAESKETALKQRLQNEYQHLPTIASGIIMRLLALTSVSTETSLKKSMPVPFHPLAMTPADGANELQKTILEVICAQIEKCCRHFTPRLSRPNASSLKPDSTIALARATALCVEMVSLVYAMAKSCAYLSTYLVSPRFLRIFVPLLFIGPTVVVLPTVLLLKVLLPEAKPSVVSKQMQHAIPGITKSFVSAVMSDIGHIISTERYMALATETYATISLPLPIVTPQPPKSPAPAPFKFEGSTFGSSPRIPDTESIPLFNPFDNNPQSPAPMAQSALSLLTAPLGSTSPPLVADQRLEQPTPIISSPLPPTSSPVELADELPPLSAEAQVCDDAGLFSVAFQLTDLLGHLASSNQTWYDTIATGIHKSLSRLPEASHPDTAPPLSPRSTTISWTERRSDALAAMALLLNPEPRFEFGSPVIVTGVEGVDVSATLVGFNSLAQIAAVVMPSGPPRIQRYALQRVQSMPSLRKPVPLDPLCTPFLCNIVIGSTVSSSSSDACSPRATGSSSGQDSIDVLHVRVMAHRVIAEQVHRPEIRTLIANKSLLATLVDEAVQRMTVPPISSEDLHLNSHLNRITLRDHVCYKAVLRHLHQFLPLRPPMEPLPIKWSTGQQTAVTLGSQGREVILAGSQSVRHGWAISEVSIPASASLFYWEGTIRHDPARGSLKRAPAFEVGFCSPSTSGEPDFAARFCMTNQNEASDPRSEGPLRDRLVTAQLVVRVGDTIGCGVVFHGGSDKTMSIFFTHNGALTGNVPFSGRPLPKSVHAVAILRSLGMTLETNFGSRPFTFPISKFAQFCNQCGTTEGFIATPASVISAASSIIKDSEAMEAHENAKAAAAVAMHRSFKKISVGVTPYKYPGSQRQANVPVMGPTGLRDIPQGTLVVVPTREKSEADRYAHLRGRTGFIIDVDENAGTVLVVIKDTFSDLLHVGHLPAYAVQYLHKNGAILTAKPIDALLSYLPFPRSAALQFSAQQAIRAISDSFASSPNASSELTRLLSAQQIIDLAKVAFYQTQWAIVSEDNTAAAAMLRKSTERLITTVIVNETAEPQDSASAHSQQSAPAVLDGAASKKKRVKSDKAKAGKQTPESGFNEEFAELLSTKPTSISETLTRSCIDANFWLTETVESKPLSPRATPNVPQSSIQIVRGSLQLAVFVLEQTLSKGPSSLRRKYAPVMFKLLLEYVEKEVPEPGPFAPEVVQRQARAELRRRCDIIALLAVVLQRCGTDTSKTCMPSGAKGKLDWLRNEIGNIYEAVHLRKSRSAVAVLKEDYLRHLIELMLAINRLGWDSDSSTLFSLDGPPSNLPPFCPDDMSVFQKLEYFTFVVECLTGSPHGRSSVPPILLNEALAFQATSTVFTIDLPTQPPGVPGSQVVEYRGHFAVTGDQVKILLTPSVPSNSIVIFSTAISSPSSPSSGDSTSHVATDRHGKVLVPSSKVDFIIEMDLKSFASQAGVPIGIASPRSPPTTSTSGGLPLTSSIDASSERDYAETRSVTAPQTVRFVLVPVLSQSQKQAAVSSIGTSAVQAVKDSLASMRDADIRFLLEEVVAYVNDRVEREGLSPFEVHRLPSAAEEMPRNFQRLCKSLQTAGGRQLATTLLFLLHSFNELAQDVVPLVDLDDHFCPGKLAHLLRKGRGFLYTQVKMALLHEELSRLPRAEQLMSIKLNRFSTHELNPPAQPGFDWDCLFMQAMRQLNGQPAHLLRNPLAGWSVQFVNESSYDTGGLFRDSLTQMCHDIQSSRLPMLILSPNALIGTASTANDQLASLPQLTPTAPTGGYPWIPNPNSESCIPLPLNFPQLFWKLLVGDKPDMNDLKEIDAYCFQCLEYLMSDEIDEINFKDLIFETFTAHLSDGSEMELKPGGQSLPVTFANRHEYVSLVSDARINESAQLADKVRYGIDFMLGSASRVLNLFDARELCLACCGVPYIDVDILMKHTNYVGFQPDDTTITIFWDTLRGFNQSQRQMFLRFVWGRETLPLQYDWGSQHNMTISRLYGRPDDLPYASTCFFTLMLPPYTTEETLKSKLLLSLSSFSIIDRDADFLAHS